MDHNVNLDSYWMYFDECELPNDNQMFTMDNKITEIGLCKNTKQVQNISPTKKRS